MSLLSVVLQEFVLGGLRKFAALSVLRKFSFHMAGATHPVGDLSTSRIFFPSSSKFVRSPRAAVLPLSTLSRTTVPFVNCRISEHCPRSNTAGCLDH